MGQGNGAWVWCPQPNYNPPIQGPYNPPPIPMSNSAKEFRQWMKAMEEWKKSNSPDKKDDKKHQDRKMFTGIEVFLLLIGTSPIVALLYKVVLIPALLR